MFSIVKKYKESIYFGLALAMLFFILKSLEYKFLIVGSNLQMYILLIAILFTAIGMYLSLQLNKPKVDELVLEKKVYVDNHSEFEINHREIAERKISKRELEVLTLIAAGKSNQEIAEHLFVSVPTVKTHSANLYDKLAVKRRTQAVEKAKNLRLIR